MISTVHPIGGTPQLENLPPILLLQQMGTAEFGQYRGGYSDFEWRCPKLG
jgi:hypothetical protein